MIPALLRTRSAAEALLRKAVSHMSTVQTTSCLVAPSALALPSPCSLVAELVALGVDKSSATRISSIYLQFVSRLKAICESDYHRRCQSQEVRHHFFQDTKSANLMPSAYLAIYTQRLSSWKSYLVNDVTPRVLAAQRWQVNPFERPSLPKRPFNQDAVPVLERFFDANAFPSRLEKLELATRCDMEYKQIHIWFQNRRSRSRKEGKMLRKQGNSHGVLKQLEDCVVAVLLPEQNGNEQGDIDSEDAGRSSDIPPLESETKDVLIHEVPPHAFPAPYPPVCPYDPFPIANGKQQVFALPWRRQCDSQSRLAEHVADIAHLATAFSVLTLGDLSGRRSQNVNPPHPSNDDPLRFSFGFATPCSRAPHPALIREPRRLSRGSCEQPYQTRMASFESRAVDASSALPLTTLSAPPTRTRRALPRRIPKNPPLSTPPRSVRRPRSPVFSRASSICSSSSSSSDVETVLLTPSSATQELPQVFPPISPILPWGGQSLNTNALDYADELWLPEKTPSRNFSLTASGP